MSDKNQHWGLKAYGVAAPFEVSLHDRLDGHAWELELSCGGTTIAAHLDSPQEVTSILSFMIENYGKTKCRAAKDGEYSGVPAGTKLFSEVASKKIKTPGEAEALISKDGELPDRFHLSVLGKGFRFHSNLHDPDTSKLISALRQVAAEMTNG
jgi:hypothetical protein